MNTNTHDDLFLRAAANGNVQYIRAMQARTVNPAYYFSKCKDLQGLTALHHGAGNGRISFLVEEVGVDINPKSTEKGVTPLLYAASMGQLVTAKYLIVRGAEIKVRDFEGFTCLHYAARKVESLNPLLLCAKYLIVRGAEIKVRDFEGFTCLLYAAREDDKELMQMLLWGGLDIDSPSVRGTPLQWAVENRKIEALKFLLAQGAKPALPPDLDDSVYLAPSDPRFRLKRSKCWLNMGKGIYALFDANSCVKCRPKWSKAHFHAGLAWMLLENYSMATKAFVEALKLDPNNFQIQVTLRQCAAQMVSDMVKKAGDKRLFIIIFCTTLSYLVRFIVKAKQAVT